MKKILIVVFSLFTFTSIYASGNKKKQNNDDVNVKIDIRTDGKGEIHINGKSIDEREIKELANKYLKNVSIEVNGGPYQKKKKSELSLTIKEK